MPIVSHNLDLYGFMYEKYNQYWAGSSYKRVIDKEYPDNDTPVTLQSDCSDEIPFIFFHNVKQSYFIDGTVEGHVKITNDSATTYTLGLCGVRIAKIDKIGTITKIGGSIRNLSSDTIGKSNEEYIAIPFRFNIKEFEIKPEEKLLLYVNITKYYNSHESNIKLLHDISTKYGNDIFIRIPLSLAI